MKEYSQNLLTLCNPITNVPKPCQVYTITANGHHIHFLQLHSNAMSMC